MMPWTFVCIGPKPHLKKKFKRFLYHYLFPYGGLFLVRLLASTYRIRLVDSENEQDILDRKGQLVYASWHQRFFPGITFFASRKPIAIIISFYFYLGIALPLTGTGYLALDIGTGAFGVLVGNIVAYRLLTSAEKGVAYRTAGLVVIAVMALTM